MCWGVEDFERLFRGVELDEAAGVSSPVVRVVFHSLRSGTNLGGKYFVPIQKGR